MQYILILCTWKDIDNVTKKVWIGGHDKIFSMYKGYKMNIVKYNFLIMIYKELHQHCQAQIQLSFINTQQQNTEHSQIYKNGGLFVQK